MNSSLAKLAGLGSGPLGPSVVLAGDAFHTGDLEELGLLELLRLKNGFYAFEGALHVYPTSASGHALEDWNSPSAWRDAYQGLADGCVFFAEDAFGCQFCVYERRVATFDPETGEKSFIATDVREWAGRILADYEVLTGYPLAHAWQERHGAIPPGQRLVPKIPFVLGGEFAVENLFLLDASRSMRSRANLAVQIKDLPDGAKVKFKIVD